MILEEYMIYARASAQWPKDFMKDLRWNRPVQSSKGGTKRNKKSNMLHVKRKAKLKRRGKK